MTEKSSELAVVICYPQCPVVLNGIPGSGHVPGAYPSEVGEMMSCIEKAQRGKSGNTFFSLLRGVAANPPKSKVRASALPSPWVACGT